MKKTPFVIPTMYNSKLRSTFQSEDDFEIEQKNIMATLEVVADNAEKHLNDIGFGEQLFICFRSKDPNEGWNHGIVACPLSNLESGNEFIYYTNNKRKAIKLTITEVFDNQ